MIQNRLAANSAHSLVDIGKVGRTHDVNSRYWGHHEDFFEEYNVDAVDMNTKCHRRHGYGHMSRDCAAKLEKGNGTGGEEKGGYRGKRKETTARGTDGATGMATAAEWTARAEATMTRLRVKATWAYVSGAERSAIKQMDAM